MEVKYVECSTVQVNKVQGSEVYCLVGEFNVLFREVEYSAEQGNTIK